MSLTASPNLLSLSDDLISIICSFLNAKDLFCHLYCCNNRLRELLEESGIRQIWLSSSSFRFGLSLFKQLKKIKKIQKLIIENMSLLLNPKFIPYAGFMAQISNQNLIQIDITCARSSMLFLKTSVLKEIQIKLNVPNQHAQRISDVLNSHKDPWIPIKTCFPVLQFLRLQEATESYIQISNLQVDSFLNALPPSITHFDVQFLRAEQSPNFENFSELKHLSIGTPRPSNIFHQRPDIQEIKLSRFIPNTLTSLHLGFDLELSNDFQLQLPLLTRLHARIQTQNISIIPRNVLELTALFPDQYDWTNDDLRMLPQNLKMLRLSCTHQFVHMVVSLNGSGTRELIQNLPSSIEYIDWFSESSTIGPTLDDFFSMPNLKVLKYKAPFDQVYEEHPNRLMSLHILGDIRSIEFLKKMPSSLTELNIPQYYGNLDPLIPLPPNLTSINFPRASLNIDSISKLSKYLSITFCNLRVDQIPENFKPGRDAILSLKQYIANKMLPYQHIRYTRIAMASHLSQKLDLIQATEEKRRREAKIRNQRILFMISLSAIAAAAKYLYFK